ncbi:MAG: ribosome-associated translation inhibitor RaiA [Planctomycetota bacterium]
MVGRHFEVTDAIREHAETKGEKLPRYFDRTQLITFTIEKQDSVEYKVECIVDVEGHDDFIANAHDEDVYKAIDSSVHKATRQLTDYKEKLKQEHHR